MNINGDPNSTERNITIIKGKILNKCKKLGTKEEKITYLKKVISDCNRIINLAEKIDGKYLDVNFLLNEEKDIDEYLIMYLDGLCKLPASPPPEKTGRKDKIPWVVKQPKKYYQVYLTDGGRVCDIQIAFGGMKSFKEGIKDQITVIEAEGKNEEMPAINAEDRIKIETGKLVIVRIFECMKKAGIIWSETPTKDIAELFFSDVQSKLKFVNYYNQTKNRIEKEESATNNKKLLDFTLLLIEKNFKGKEKELEIILRHIEGLQKNVI